MSDLHSETATDATIFVASAYGESLVSQVMDVAQALPDTPLVLVCDIDDPNTLPTLVRSGADEVLAPDTPPERLAAAIHVAVERDQRIEVQSEAAPSPEQLTAQRLAAIVDTTSDAILSKTLDGIITSWNQGAERVYGYTAHEMIGASVTKLVPDDRKAELEEFKESLADGKTVENYMTVRCRKDGTELRVSLSIAPLYGPHGDVVGASTIARDMTAQLDAVELATKNTRLLREMGRLARVGGWVINVDTMEVLTTEQVARIHNLDPAHDFDFSEALAYLSDESRERTRKAIDEAIETGQDYSLDLELNPPDGKTKFVSVVGHPESENGQVLKIWGAIQDITDRKESEREIRALNTNLEEEVRKRTAELIETNEELEAFSYSVSHDLRSPLRTIDGFSRIVLDKYGNELPEGGRHYLERIVANTRDMADLIDNLLRFSRLQRRDLRYTVFDPGAVAASVIHSLEDDIDTSNAAINLSNLPACRADREMIRQVFSNLIGNALKFSRNRDRPVIDIDCRENDGLIEYYVKDNGVGFNMEYADKLFDVFQRLHPREDFEGTGIGLALVQRILRRHGASIRGVSRPDEGATFYFTLPEAEPHE